MATGPSDAHGASTTHPRADAVPESACVSGRVALVVDPSDDVATLLDDERGLTRLRDGTEIAAGISFGHKVALRAIGAGEPVRKYGVVIGRATADIARGAHVHVHNLA